MISRWIRPVLATVAVALAVWQVSLLVALLRGGSDATGGETATVKRGPFVVGMAREGNIESADVAVIRAPEGGSTLTWLIDDGAEVKAGDLIAKVDVSEFRFEVDGQRIEYRDALNRIEQERRDRTRDRESAQTNVDKVLRSLQVLLRSQLTESQQGEAQIGFDRWNLRWAEQDYDKNERLSDAGILPQTTVEQSERTVRSRQHALAKSEKQASYLTAEHAAKKEQARSDIDTAKFDAELADRRIGEAVDSARERADLAGEQLGEMEKQLAAAEVRAPKAGVVVLGKTWSETGRRTFKEGDRIWSRMKLADITNMGALEVGLRIDEGSVHRLKVGQKAVITVKTAPDREFEGEVLSIGAVAHEVVPWEDPNAVPGQRVFDVAVKILKPDLKLLRPGVSASVQFVSRRIPEAIFVPVQAVFDRPEGHVVYVQQGRRFLPRRVETGERNDKSVVVLKGLEPGELVALSDPTRGEAS